MSGVIRSGATRLVQSGLTAITPFIGSVTSIDIPDTAEPGDLMVLTLIGSYAPGEGSEAKSDDPRMTPISMDTVDNARYAAYYGPITDDRSPLSIDFRITGEGSVGHLVGLVLLVTIRMEGADAVVVDTGRQSSVEWRLGDSLDRSEPPLPGLADGGQGALCIIASGQVGVGGVEMAYDRCDPPWRFLVGDGSYVEVALLVTDNIFVREAANPNENVNAWRADLLGLIGIFDDITPVTRQYPRDDGRGLSAGPRIHPNPRGPLGGRIVGGHL